MSTGLQIIGFRNLTGANQGVLLVGLEAVKGFLETRVPEDQET